MARRGDPFFNDPFFGGGQDPFARMNNMMNTMFNDPFFGGGGFGPSFGGHMGLPGHAHQQQQYPRGGGGGAPTDDVTIEEVDDHHEQRQPQYGRRAQASGAPVVEEPDDPRSQRPSRRAAGTGGGSYHQPRHAAPADPMDMMFGGMLGNMMGGMGGGGSTVYSYSSSSMSSGGPGGVTYSSTTTHRRGPGGVTETHHQEYDGRSGNETMRISRGLGNQSRTITRTRDASGQERAVDNLNNLTPEEAAQFDQRWQASAQRSLPAAGRSRASSYGRTNPALPSSTYGRGNNSGYSIREV